MIEWQFKRYVRSLGKDPDALTMTERKDLKSAMMGDLYPGKKFSQYECCEMCIGWSNLLQGLDKSPKILVDTMLPNISPDRVAKASVLVNGGYNKCQYRVSKLRGFSN